MKQYAPNQPENFTWVAKKWLYFATEGDWTDTDEENDFTRISPIGANFKGRNAKGTSVFLEGGKI
jgi:hypothetical protein